MPVCQISVLQIFDKPDNCGFAYVCVALHDKPLHDIEHARKDLVITLGQQTREMLGEIAQGQVDRNIWLLRVQPEQCQPER